jgi:hypothetical protein
MNNAVTLIVGLVGSPALLWFLSSRFDKRNTEQHNNNMAILQEVHKDVHKIGNDVKEVRKDLYQHIAFHAHKETTDGKPSGRIGDIPTRDESLLSRETA